MDNRLWLEWEGGEEAMQEVHTVSPCADVAQSKSKSKSKSRWMLMSLWRVECEPLSGSRRLQPMAVCFVKNHPMEAFAASASRGTIRSGLPIHVHSTPSYFQPYPHIHSQFLVFQYSAHHAGSWLRVHLGRYPIKFINSQKELKFDW